MNILKALKRSSLGLDLYLWLTYRTFSLKHARQSFRGSVSTASLERIQLKRSDRVTVDNFRKDCLRELIKIRTAWPTLNYSTAKGVY